MDRYDTALYAPGMVYELNEVKSNNSYEMSFANTYNEGTYMIVSSARSNSKLDTVMLAPIIEGEEYSGFGVQFMTRRGGRNVINTVCVDRMFKANQKRLKRMRYLVADDVVADVNTEMQIMLFGEPLFSRSQALGIAYREEMKLRAENAREIVRSTSQQEFEKNSEDSYVPEDFKPISQAEQEAQFARKMMTDNMPNPIVTIRQVTDVIETGVPGEDPARAQVRENHKITEETKAKQSARKPKEKTRHIVISKGKVKEKEEKKVSSNRPKYVPLKRHPGEYGMYKDIYEHWEDFLPDYATLPSDELLNKYNLPDIGTVYRLGKECKAIAKKNGVDVKEFRKKITKEVATV